MVHILSGILWMPTNVGPGPAHSRPQPAGCGASKQAPSAHGPGAAAIHLTFKHPMDTWMTNGWIFVIKQKYSLSYPIIKKYSSMI